jgi:hypothetical protein
MIVLDNKNIFDFYVYLVCEVLCFVSKSAIRRKCNSSANFLESQEVFGQYNYQRNFLGEPYVVQYRMI